MAVHALRFRIRLWHDLTLIVLVASLHIVVAFRPGNNLESPEKTLFSGAFLRSRTKTSKSSAVGAEKTLTVDEDTDKACLVLRADYVGVSDPAPVTSHAAMIDFFRDSRHTSCLISAGNTRESHAVPTTDELLQKWKRRAASLGASEPVASDIIISVAVSGINFPGVKVESISIIGSKLLLPTEATAFPSYEFILIRDERKATGLPPIVWVYNQLTGAGKEEREKDTAPMSLSRVTVCRSTDGESVTFKIKSFLEIRVNFPAVLLKILPVKKGKAEAQGGEAVTKVLKKDIDISVAKFRDMYVDTIRTV